jgi:hypothetical protein
VAKVCIFLITVALIAGTVGCDGDGLQNLEIRTWYDLDAIRDNLGGSYILMNDLDSTTLGYEELASPTANGGKGWQPIGAWGDRFTGSLDGQGYEIRDLFIARPDDDWVGLFSIVDDTGVVKNVGVVNADVLGRNRVGALVGQNEGSVVNCYSTGSVGGEGRVGGLVGLNYRFRDQPDPFAIIGDPYSEVGIISDSYSAASVSGEWSIGGLVGSNDDILSRSYSTGDVTGRTLIGGLVGCGSGNVNNSYFTGSVTGDVSVGGLVGACRATVSNSHYDYDEVLINGENIITIGALFSEDFEEWLANDKFLDIDERLSEEDGYYVVNNLTDFKELLAFGQNDTLKFRLTNDLDLGGDPNFYIPYLAGEFDGNGHRILNLSFNFDFVSQVGLFGYLAPGGKISQVGVENMNITGGRTIGGLVGLNVNGIIDNSYSSGSVTGAHWVGGLVGHNDGTVSNSYSTSNVTGDSGVGGLVAYNDDTVSNSYSTSNVTGGDCVGGLVGETWAGTVSNSYSTGSVTGVSYVGGLVGYIYYGEVSNSYSTGSVTGLEDVGGLVGANEGYVSSSYSTGSVTGGYYVGGLVGVNLETINNSYSTGSVTGNDYVGGLVGSNYLLGNNGTVSSSFWDTETSGQATSAGGTGKTTVEMQDIATFSGATWDICKVDPDQTNPTYIWNIVDEQTYPFLSWEW